jgi:thioredoxin:protein disulfide reductase
MSFFDCMKLRLLTVGLLVGTLGAAAPLRSSSQVPNANEVVAPTAYASADPVARNVPFQLAVVLKIRPGFHINAREKSAAYLIATDLKYEMPTGFTAGEAIYPKGTLHTFAFSKDKPLNVYEDAVTLKLPVTATGDAPLGEQHIALKVRYQACSQEVCLPPVTLPVTATVTVVATGTKGAHAEIFATR